MITKDIATRLHYREELWHESLKNADGTPLRCRVNGKCKTWKREPERWQLPVKYGLKVCFYITHRLASNWYGDSVGYDAWYLPDDHRLLDILADIAGLAPGTEAGIVRDKLMEENRPEAVLLDPIVFGTNHSPSELLL